MGSVSRLLMRVNTFASVFRVMFVIDGIINIDSLLLKLPFLLILLNDVELTRLYFLLRFRHLFGYISNEMLSFMFIKIN